MSPKRKRNDKLARCFRQVVSAQVVLACLAISVVWLLVGSVAALSSLLGSVLALSNTWITQRSIQKSSELAYASPDMSMLPVFSGLIQRLVLFSAGMLVGILVFHLLPLYILTGFIVLQLGYLACKMT